MTQGEPFPEAGANQGLTVMLNADTDLVEALSDDSDYGGFKASVTSPREFPLIFQNGFKGTLLHPWLYFFHSSIIWTKINLWLPNFATV